RSTVAPFESIVDIDGFARGENLLGRVSHAFSPDSDLTLQVYVDSYRRVSLDVSQQVDTADFDFGHRFRPCEGHELVWGLGYRRFRTELRGTFDVMLGDPKRTDDLWSAFVQDDLTVVPDALTFTLGSKFEINDFTGFEYQPSARLTFTPDERQTFWAAVSRAVRTPSVIEQDGIVNFGVI